MPARLENQELADQITGDPDLLRAIGRLYRTTAIQEQDLSHHDTPGTQNKEVLRVQEGRLLVREPEEGREVSHVPTNTSKSPKYCNTTPRKCVAVIRCMYLTFTVPKSQDG